jgi:AcrR family transcriptional regulator
MSLETDRPLRADAERNRRRLLDAARVLLAERGLDVSMDDIARAAGVGVGTAYRRFRNRDEIIDALFDEQLSGMEERARVAAESADAWEGLKAFMIGSLRAQAENRGLKQLLFSQAEGREKVHAMRARMLPLMEQVVARAQADGNLRRDFTVGDIPVLSFMIGSVVDFAGSVDDEVWERYLGLLLDGLRPGAATPLPRPSLDQQQLEAAMECWRPARR